MSQPGGESVIRRRFFDRFGPVSEAREVDLGAEDGVPVRAGSAEVLPGLVLNKL